VELGTFDDLELDLVVVEIFPALSDLRNDLALGVAGDEIVEDVAVDRIAVGVNCTDPRFVTPLLRSISRKEDFVIYPNAGRVWDADSKVWIGDRLGFGQYIADWIDSGARYVGGCCGVGPEQIAELRL